MNLPYILAPHPTRVCKIYEKNSEKIPKNIFDFEPVIPDFSDFPLPLPSKKSDYRCSAITADGAVWAGASNGVTRCNLKEKDNIDKVMFFSFERDLADNDVKNIAADGNSVWVLTEKGVSHIEIKLISPEEKASLLLEESLKYVDRRGMQSQKELSARGDVSSAVSYGHSDNDGGFTACFASAEILRYGVLKKEKGIDAPETIEAKKIAVKAVEAVLLLMYIHGRGNGFVARSYLCPGEPVPDDGLFFKKQGGKAVCLETSYAKMRGLAGKEFDASSPVPERLARLYKDEGYSDDGIVFKGDTSSDEITLEFMMLWLAHNIIGDDDKELDTLIKDAVTNTMNHIIDNDRRLVDCSGEPTTWARWYPDYFKSSEGWVDACLNSAELLMYLRVAMDLTGEQPKWVETYKMLIDEGYADLGQYHYDRQTQSTTSSCIGFCEDIMYGDHMLATASFYVLCCSEKDETLLAKYRKGFSTWRSSIEREYSPVYDFPYLAACPDAELDMERIAVWFTRANVSRIASSVTMTGRHDVPVVKLRGGYLECGWVAAPDERFVSKPDRNPLEYKNEDSGGAAYVESCYYYTFGYWFGRYYGFIAQEDN